MKITSDDTKILLFLCSNPNSTSTQITRGIYAQNNTYQLRSQNSKVIYRLSLLEEMNLIKSSMKRWSTTNNVSVGVSKIVFSTDEQEASIGVGPSMLIVVKDEYQIIKIDPSEP